VSKKCSCGEDLDEPILVYTQKCWACLKKDIANHENEIEKAKREGLLEAYRDVLLNGFERNIDTFEFIRKRIEEFERGEKNESKKE